MELLASNFQPLKTEHHRFNETFKSLLSESNRLDIAVGYISESSLDELADLIHKKNGLIICNLVIGMHYFDKFTYAQYAAVKETENFLLKNRLGTVKLVTCFPFHGKIYSFHKENGDISSIIGSSNMSNIQAHNPLRQYELDVLIEDKKINNEMISFITSLSELSIDLSSPDLKITEFKKVNNLLEDLENVEYLDDYQILNSIKEKVLSTQAIEIPITTSENAPGSNINACFGKGRENKNTGIIRSRPWYEVELIVPKKITDLSWYPKAGYPNSQSVITVITDDGYKFDCKISGTNSKNFRSVGDLTILGKWLKGRLENAGVLKVGEPVTQQTLQKYGRNSLMMSPTKIKNTWYLDFNTNMEL